MNKQLDSEDYTSLGFNTGRPVFIHNDLLDAFHQVEKEYRTNYHMTNIKRTLIALNTDSSKELNPTGNTHTIVCGRATMQCTLLKDAVLIHLLEFDKQDSQPAAELYCVSYNKKEKDWFLAQKPIGSLSLVQQWKSNSEKAHYAAVAARSTDIEDAASRTPDYILRAFLQADFLTSWDRGDEYALFWSKADFHKSREAAESLASIIQQSKINNLAVNWLIHGEGFYTFRNAVKLINATQLSHIVEHKKNDGAEKENKQHVFFYNRCDSSSEKSLQVLCEQAGLSFAGINSNHRDLRRWVILKNAIMKTSGSLLTAIASGFLLVVLIKKLFP